jgi:paraquat-inducible protein B
MSRQANPTVIGGFVLGALVLVVAAILIFSSGAWFRQRVAMVTYFPGSVQGLSVGAQVQFQGVQVGQVTAIGLDYVIADNSFRIPVSYEIWPDTIGLIGKEAGDLNPPAFAKRLVMERGLRAKLEPVSLITGQYVVSLGLGTTSPPHYVGGPHRGIEIPAIESTRDRVLDMLEKLPVDDLVDGLTGTLAAIRSLLDSGAIQALIKRADDTLTQIGHLSGDLDERVKPLGEQLSQTLAQYGALGERLSARVDGVADSLMTAAASIAGLSRHLDTQVEPLATNANAVLHRADSTLATVQGAVDQGSDLRYGLDRLLSEATGAARALRSLADYLERHPEALVTGKR